MFEPGQSLSLFHRFQATETQFRVMGPVPSGSMIVRVGGHVRLSGASSSNLGVSLGASPEPSDAAFRAGTSLLGSSTLRNSGHPVMHFEVGVAEVLLFQWYVGLEVDAGPRWVHLAMENASNVFMDWMVSVQVVRRVVLGAGRAAPGLGDALLE